MRENRPIVILQNDRFDRTESITVCAFTTDPIDAPLFRPPCRHEDIVQVNRASLVFLGIAAPSDRESYNTRINIRSGVRVRGFSEACLTKHNFPWKGCLGVFQVLR
jgi:PemK-like, MazF-like toxin of type II toxin-antitoxin system